MAQQRGVTGKKAEKWLASSRMKIRRKNCFQSGFSVEVTNWKEKAGRQTDADRRSVNMEKFSNTLLVYSRTAGYAGILTVIRQAYKYSFN